MTTDAKVCGYSDRLGGPCILWDGHNPPHNDGLDIPFIDRPVRPETDDETMRRLVIERDSALLRIADLEAALGGTRRWASAHAAAVRDSGED